MSEIDDKSTGESVSSEETPKQVTVFVGVRTDGRVVVCWSCDGTVNHSFVMNADEAEALGHAFLCNAEALRRQLACSALGAK